jgi:hypothetical protein
MTRFYGKEMLALRPTPELEDNPMSAVRECFFNIFAATIHNGDRFSIKKLRTRNIMCPSHMCFFI